MSNNKRFFAEFWAAAWGLKRGQDYDVKWKGTKIRLTYMGITTDGKVGFTGTAGKIALPLVEGQTWTMKIVQ